MAKKPLTLTPPGADYSIHVLGDQSHPIRDFYHGVLRLTWPRTFLVIAAGFLLVNALFACAYTACDGIGGARPGSFEDAFYFSVETMGTIGYGAMFPQSRAANLLMVLESIVSLVLTALATGLVFAKFSRPTARVRFTRHAVISAMNGVPTLMLRLGNERGNQIVDTQFRVTCSRIETTHEGKRFYRTLDVKLVRDRALSLNRSFSVMHVIDEQSPLHQIDAVKFSALDMELSIMVVGLDDTTMQVVHANHQYFPKDVRWGMRHVDILSENPDGSLTLDLNKFHDTEEAL